MGAAELIAWDRQSNSPSHIGYESFDDPDLFGLAGQFPAVVARAGARWEEEPRYPSYVKPTPQSRGRRLRQQEPAETANAEGEAGQELPQTLRLF